MLRKTWGELRCSEDVGWTQMLRKTWGEHRCSERLGVNSNAPKTWGELRCSERRGVNLDAPKDVGWTQMLRKTWVHPKSFGASEFTPRLLSFWVHPKSFGASEFTPSLSEHLSWIIQIELNLKIAINFITIAKTKQNDWSITREFVLVFGLINYAIIMVNYLLNSINWF
jgi:hypothetical protein